MADNLTLRKEVSTLQASELAALRDAYQQMMAISGADNRSWIYWAEYHGFNRNDCWHHGIIGLGSQQTYDLFLPWHRAYLLYFEHTFRDRNPGAVLPWWDWTSAGSHASGLPAAFTAPTVNGAANPLFRGPVPSIQGAPAYQTTRYPGPPNQLPTAADVAAKVKLGSFIDFTSQLEDIHDSVHGWVGGLKPGTTNQGGDMGAVVTSAFDPIFWSHHCMIDRIWYLWQLQNGNGSIPQDWLNKPLAPWALTVADVLDIRQLGYEYAASGVSVTTSGSGGTGNSLGTGGNSSSTGGIATNGGTVVASSDSAGDSSIGDSSADGRASDASNDGSTDNSNTDSGSVASNNTGSADSGTSEGSAGGSSDDSSSVADSDGSTDTNDDSGSTDSGSVASADTGSAGSSTDNSTGDIASGTQAG